MEWHETLQCGGAYPKGLIYQPFSLIKKVLSHQSYLNH